MQSITLRVLGRRWDLQEIEVTLSHRIDVSMKYTIISKAYEECFLCVLIIRYNDGLYEFLPLNDLRWHRQAMEPGEIIHQNVLGPFNVVEPW
jgi:hypothetical protein